LQSTLHKSAANQKSSRNPSVSGTPIYLRSRGARQSCPTTGGLPVNFSKSRGFLASVAEARVDAGEKSFLYAYAYASHVHAVATLCAGTHHNLTGVQGCPHSRQTFLCAEKLTGRPPVVWGQQANSLKKGCRGGTPPPAVAVGQWVPRAPLGSWQTCPRNAGFLVGCSTSVEIPGLFLVECGGLHSVF
jgi:hypothetical protein